MLRPRPTQIRPTIDEYLSPGRRREIFTTGYAFKTQWTRSMLLRLRKFDNTGLSDEDILATLQKEFKGPDRVEEIWQERALLATGPRTDDTWNIPMEKKVIGMANAGKTVMEITVELHRLYKKPGVWAETYRKIQQLKVNGWIEVPTATEPTTTTEPTTIKEPTTTAEPTTATEPTTPTESWLQNLQGLLRIDRPEGYSGGLPGGLKYYVVTDEEQTAVPHVESQKVSKMDFIEGIGERYLMGKAYAAPQQLENLAKKQFKGDAAATSASAKPQSAAPNVRKNKEIEDLKKQLAEVKAAQEKPANEPSERRKSIESAVNRGRSRKARERHESPPGKKIQAAENPHHHHHAQADRSKGKGPAVGNAREMPAGKSSSSSVSAPTARPATLTRHGERHAPRTGQKDYSTATGQGRSSHGKAQARLVTNAIHQRNITDHSRGASASQRPRPATDLCVVEVMEEEPRNRRRDRGQRSNVVEVIEKKGNRTRYVVN
ncbi:MAG: hypothetical protein Q9221_002461 [Calogaya cf. arnoldii]